MTCTHKRAVRQKQKKGVDVFVGNIPHGGYIHVFCDWLRHKAPFEKMRLYCRGSKTFVFIEAKDQTATVKMVRMVHNTQYQKRTLCCYVAGEW